MKNDKMTNGIFIEKDYDNFYEFYNDIIDQRNIKKTLRNYIFRGTGKKLIA